MGAAENTHMNRAIDSFEKYTEVCRQIAVDRLASITGKKWEPVDVEEWDRLLFSSHIIMITLAGKDLRVFLKVHYRPGRTKAVLENVKSKITDVVSEYSNLLAGGVKQMLLDSGVICGLSLPTLLTGIDEAILSDVSKSHRFIDCFALQFSETQIFVTIATDVTSDIVKSSILDCKYRGSDSDEIEFL